MIDAEKYVEAGQALIGLGRMIQRTFPPVNDEGAQFGEDSILAKLLPEASGIYVDCGAHSPRDCSNTWQFYKRGWDGLLIEPLIDCWPQLLLERPRDILFPGAASNFDGFSTLNVCRSVSSLDACWRKDNESRMPVLTEKLSTILARYPFVEWSKTSLLSVDVEGHEKQVLEGIPWDWFKPTVIICEWAAQDGSDQSGPWLPILTANGYKEIFRNKLNLLMKHE